MELTNKVGPHEGDKTRKVNNCYDQFQVFYHTVALRAS